MRKGREKNQFGAFRKGWEPMWNNQERLETNGWEPIWNIQERMGRNLEHLGKAGNKCGTFRKGLEEIWNIHSEKPAKSCLAGKNVQICVWGETNLLWPSC